MPPFWACFSTYLVFVPGPHVVLHGDHWDKVQSTERDFAHGRLLSCVSLVAIWYLSNLDVGISNTT